MTSAENANKNPIFQPLSGSDEDTGITEIESLCTNCLDQGVTRLLLTRIPFFRDVIISSFSCPHCNNSNNDLQSASPIQEKGCIYTLQVNPKSDMNRQIVKSDSTVIKIPEMDFEIPPKSQKGNLTTIEGVIQRAIDGLELHQPVRRVTEPAVAEKIDAFLDKFKKLLTRIERFEMVLDDPAGNSFVENPNAPDDDPNMKITHYTRTCEQDELLGIMAAEDNAQPTEEVQEDLTDEVHIFRGNCCTCNAPILTKMKTVDIPHFKQVIIMATSCDSCGYKSNEVKSGSGFETKGKRMTLNITDSTDLSRDVLKSETCSIAIPELELDVGQFCVSGKFTTIEGLLTDIRDMIMSKNSFLTGDSATGDMKVKFQKFDELLGRMVSGEEKFTIILDDPAGNSYLQNIYAPENDPEMKTEMYERTFEQNEDLGLNDMKV